MVPWATTMSAILMRYWFGSSRMLSRMRTFGRITPISAATLCRTRWMRSSKSPPRFGSASRIKPTPSSTLHRVDGQVVLDAMLGLFGGFGPFLGLRPLGPSFRGGKG